MKRTEIINQLKGAAQEQREFCDTVPRWSDDWFTASHKAEAMTEAAKRLDTPSDRCIANELLLWIGLILGAVGVISTVAGIAYIMIGDCTKAWAMLPWAITSALVSLVAFAGVRK